MNTIIYEKLTICVSYNIFSLLFVKMMLNVSDEEKYEIVKNNSHKWKPFSKLEESYLQFLNISLIFETIIEIINKSIVISYDNTMDHNDYTYDIVKQDFRNNWIENKS